MRVGLVIGLHGSRGGGPTWAGVRDQAQAAERHGFDVAVIEDALLYRDDDGALGYWESVSMAGALCACTARIEVGHSAMNAPYRAPALTAKVAETLDEISGGRFFLGIGLGNTMDYDQFGVPADKRFARFAETIEIIHDLLREGRIDFEGQYHSARGADLVLRGPRPHGPPIVIAARGPRMLRITARLADGWNWWTGGVPDLAGLRGLNDEMDRACADERRDPGTLSRSLDIYSVDPLGIVRKGDRAIGGTTQEIAARLLELSALGFAEIRCALLSPAGSGRLEAIAAMGDVVALLREERPDPAGQRSS